MSSDMCVLPKSMQHTCMHRQPQKVLVSVPYVSTRKYCSHHVYTYFFICLSTVVPTLVEGPRDENIVINTSSARSMENVAQSVTFTCIIDSQPLANVDWFFDSNTNINESRISIRTDTPSLERQVTVLTISPVQLGDQGQVTCSANSTYGSISSTAYLKIFGTSIANCYV